MSRATSLRTPPTAPSRGVPTAPPRSPVDHDSGLRAPTRAPAGPARPEAFEAPRVAAPGRLSAPATRAVALVPARDEAASVGGVVRALCALPLALRVLVIDDGSLDGTAEVARAAGAEVLSHVEPRGNGASIKSGLAASDEPWVVIVDGDGQHDPHVVPRLLAGLADGADLVVGARTDFAGSGRLRALGNRVLGALASYMTGADVPDLTSGLRAFRRASLQPHVGLLPEGFSTPTTSTLALLHDGKAVRFVPVASRLRSQGRTHTRLLDDGARFVSIALRVSKLFRPWRARLPLLAGLAVAVQVGLGGGSAAWVLAGTAAPACACLLVGAWRSARGRGRLLDPR